MPFTDFGQSFDADNENRFVPTIEGADAYFKPDRHLLSTKWKDQKDANVKSAALYQAQQYLELSKGRIMETPTEDDQLGPRDDYAVYEMALHLLESQFSQSGRGPVKTLSDRKKSKTREDNGILIPPHVDRLPRTDRKRVDRA